jgi:hypothetical protein
LVQAPSAQLPDDVHWPSLPHTVPAGALTMPQVMTPLFSVQV